jgi:acyl-CoA synthetase (AMP-forming)/AMP-acid ligase II
MKQKEVGARHRHPLLPDEVQEEYRRSGYWEERTLPQIVEQWVKRDPGRTAITGPRRLSYVEVWEESRRLAGSLTEAGLKPGEFLAALMSSSWQGVVLELAAAMAGAVFTPRSSHLSAIGAESLFDQLDVRGVVLNADMLEKEDWRAAMTGIRERLRGRPLLVQGELPEGSPFADLPTLEAAAASGPATDPTELDPGAPCLVLSSGGTTGQPKSIIHCSNGLVYAARCFGRATDYSESDVQVAFAPYGHAGGSVFDVYMPFIFGASILPLGRWQALSVAEAIERWGGTYYITMGTHVFDMLGLDPSADRLFRSVRLITSGAGPDELYENGEKRFGFPIVRVYGCSETPGLAIGRPSDPGEVRWHRDGVPFPGLAYRLVDVDSGEPVAKGRAGEFQVQGPNLFMGYFGQPEATAAAVTPEGFYRSGDLMVESGDRYLTWSGRTKDIIRRGGLQIDPVEMENWLAGHERISEVLVVGEPDPRLGERAVVVCVPRNAAAPPTLEELCDYLLKQGLPKQNLPEKLVLATSIPRTELGKFHRVEVKRHLVEGEL